MAGHLLREEQRNKEDEDITEEWTIIHQPAIKEEEPLKYPETCEVVRDDREPGEALCPERYDKSDLKRIKSQVGKYKWSSLYQQKPISEEGKVWNAEWFNKYSELPDDAELVGNFWDLAYTAKERNSASAFVQAFEDEDGNVYIHRAEHAWKEFPDLVNWMSTVEGVHYVESKASGKSAVQTLSSSGVYAEELDISGDKIARAKLVSPLGENGRVYIHERIYEYLLLDANQGIIDFPEANGDDLADAFHMALHEVSGIGDEKSDQTIGISHAPII